MRTSAALLVLATTLAILGCDDDKKSGATTTAATTTTAMTATTMAATTTATATAAPSPSVTAAPVPMPPRPVPLGSSGPIQPSAPADQQMMAITYTLAMVQPRGNDPLTVDKTYLDDVLKKLEGAVRGVDKGKTPANPVKATRGNRKIEIEMGRGCTDRIPSSIAQRAGSSLKAAYDAGVLVIACHDDKWECHQSTRDTNDVLCHAAPRH